MERRTFLKAAGIGGSVLLCGGAAYALLHDAEPLAEHLEATEIVLVARYGVSSAKGLVASVAASYRDLRQQAPSIGGDANMFSQWLDYGVYYLAVYRVLAAAGAALQVAGALIYDIFQAQAHYPAWVMRSMGRLRHGVIYQRRLKAAAEATQLRRFGGDWVASWVEGDGDAFDYGLDVHECGIRKFYAAQGAAELTPYICLADEVTSRAMGRGLVRHMTRAEGFSYCDFRYKWGRETYVAPLQNGWPPQFGKTDFGNGCKCVSLEG
jgi:hypothetical protein